MGDFVFYDQFAKLCKERSVSPSAVMVSIGLNKSNATFWKKGSIPKGDTLQKLAAYFGVSVDYLLENEELQENEDIESAIDQIADEHRLSNQDREIIKTFLKLNEPARSALLGYAERLAEESRNKPSELDSPMDINSQLELCRHGMLMGIAVAQANYSIRPEDVDIDNIEWTPELSAMVEDELEKRRHILEEEQRRTNTAILPPEPTPTPDTPGMEKPTGGAENGE